MLNGVVAVAVLVGVALAAWCAAAAGAEEGAGDGGGGAGQPSTAPAVPAVRLSERDVAEGNTPLHAAVRMYSLDEARALLDAGVDPDVRNNAGLTPLHIAALVGDGNPPAIELLLDRGADINAKTTAEYGYVSGVLGGAWANTVDLVVPAGSTPLDVARMRHDQKKWNTYKHMATVELLEERGGKGRFRLGLGGWLAIGCGGMLLVGAAAVWGIVALVRVLMR